MEDTRPEVAESDPGLDRIVVTLAAVVVRVVVGSGLPVQVAASDEMVTPLDAQTTGPGVEPDRSRLPLEKMFEVLWRTAVNTAAAAMVGTTTYHNAPRPKAAKKRRGWRATDPRVKDLSSWLGRTLVYW